MRTRLSVVVFAAVVGIGSAAQAQQPINPYGTADVAGPATDPGAPIDPYAYPYGYGYGNYPPPAPRLQPLPPAQPQQPGYYLYPAQPQQPQYAPPSCYDPCAAYRRPVYQPYYQPYYGYAYPQRPVLQSNFVRRPAGPTERIRRFSLGVHGTALGINQQVGGKDVVLGGAGLQLRIRSKGRFGLELNQSFLGNEYLNGNFQRQSYPFMFALMLYIFPNQETRHFNIYGLAGVGAMMDTVKLRDQNGNMARQDFLEWMLQGGAGLELRWKWFALAADVRVVGLFLEKSSKPAAYYAGVQGGPIPDKSFAVMGNVFVNFWF